MRVATAIAIVLLGATFLGWFVLRVREPELEKKVRGALIAGAAAIGGALLVLLTLGRKKPKELEPEKPTELEIHEETRETYATKDNFEELRDGADDLEPAPTGGSLSDELRDFRAGSDKLLE